MKMQLLSQSGICPRKAVQQGYYYPHENLSGESGYSTLYISGFHSSADDCHRHNKALEKAGLLHHPRNRKDNSCSGQNYTPKVKQLEAKKQLSFNGHSMVIKWSLGGH
jgi:hypothetical protein